jgi:aryl-alcohol dehydrogenase-like predicted oxidoreductase
VIDLYYQHRVGSRHADRGHGRRHGAARERGQGPLPRLSEAGRRHCAARARSTRSRPCRANTRCGPAIPRTRSSRRAARSGSAWVAYSPLGRGFLTGQITRFEDLDGRRLSRFPAALPGATTSPRTWSSYERIRSMAERQAAAPRRNWRSPGSSRRARDIVAIPGTKRPQVSRGEPRRARGHVDHCRPRRPSSAALRAASAAGTRYPEAMMSFVNR